MAEEGYLNTVFRGDPNDTTEWDDIQRKLGNFAPKPKPPKAAAWEPEAPESTGVEWVDKRDEQELAEAEDDFKDDRFLEDYRQQRIRELQQAQLRPRFGTVEDIRGSEFVAQVTNAGTDVWVVVHLYKDGHGGSALVGTCLEELARKYPSTKFLRIVSTDCIPKYPDANLPTLLLYNDGTCVQHLSGLAAIGGARTTPEQVAMALNKYGSFCVEGDDEESAARNQVWMCGYRKGKGAASCVG